MHGYSKLSTTTTMLSIVTLLKGFASTTYIAYSNPVDPNYLPGMADNPAFSLLRGRIKDKET